MEDLQQQGGGGATDSLFLATTGTQESSIVNNSRATSPSGETDQLLSSDDEGQGRGQGVLEGAAGGQVQNMEEEEEPRITSATQSLATMQEEEGEGQATSTGGAIAGPGPSSSLKRSANNINSSVGPLPPPAPPLKKKRGRASIPLINNSYNPPELPHHEIIKCIGKNDKSNRHVIKFKDSVSDGTKSKWPSDQEFDRTNKDSSGKINWYERQGKDSGKHKNQLERIGDELAIKLNLNPKDKKEYWILDSYPKDYVFTIHHNITGSGQQRQDPYVFGSPVCAKFRSANEIIPHLHWLLIHAPRNRQLCKCRYCAKKPQSEVNKIEGLNPNNTERASTPGQAPNGHGGNKPKRSSNLATIKKEKKPRISTASTSSKRSSQSPKPFLNDDVDDDEDFDNDNNEELDANNNNTSKPLIRSRTFNSSEPEPSYSGAFVDKQRDSDLLSGAKFRKGEMVWAIVPQGALLFSQPTGNGGSNEDSKVCVTHWPAIIETREERTESKLANQEEDGEYVVGSNSIPRFTNKKSWVYSIVYLGTRNNTSALNEKYLKSWLDTSVPDNVWGKEKLLNPDTVGRIWDGNRITKAELGTIEALEQAVAPLAFAMQIAAHVMSGFSVVDRYIIKDGHFVTPPSPEELPRHVVSEMELAKKNWFYQSLYFGSELIWINDFVRIIHSRKSSLPPHHSLSLGSEKRSLFMQVQAIWKDHDNKRCELTGQIYELRDLMLHEDGAGSGSIGAGVGGLGAMSMFERKSSNGAAGSPRRTASTAQNDGARENESGSPLMVDETSTPPQISTSGFYSTPLPPAPEGFEFNRITPGESQITIALEYLAGRYYPLPKPLNSRSKIDQVIESLPFGRDFEQLEGDEDGEEEKKTVFKLTDEHRAIALAGLTPAIALFCKSKNWKGDRMSIMVDAETSACQEVAHWFEKALKA